MSEDSVPKTPPKVKMFIGAAACLAALADWISTGSMSSMYFVLGGGIGYFLARL